MSKHEMWELQSMQAASLGTKIALTKQRIREWVNAYGEDGVYVSFSGGKDSTVLLRLVREEYPYIPAIFVDTGLEYPEIRDFVKTFDNVTWLKPKKTFKQVVEDYGYPFISKEVSERVYFAQKFLREWGEEHGESPSDPEKLITDFINTSKTGTYKLKQLYGFSKQKDGTKSAFNCDNWKMLASCPYKISSKCCDVMKKSPVKRYEHKTGRHGMTAMMASESRVRTITWLKHGCNAFDAKRPASNPMAFWTEQDVLLYIYKNHVPIASVYGDVVKETEVEGQLDFADLGIFDLGRPMLKTTGCHRTGCVFCGFGCHLEKPGNGRFEKLKETHPKLYDYIMRPLEGGGLNYKAMIDWLNENADVNIKY